MFELILPFIVTLCWTITGFCVGAIWANRKHRRENAATAECAACAWNSGPVPLGMAFKLAESHTMMPHPAGEARPMVVRA